jgi:hypothetical protein
MNRSKDLISLIEEGPGGFSSTINGFALIASDENGDVVEKKVISMVETDNVQGAIYDLQDVIEFLNRHKDKQIDMSEPVL